MLGFLLSADLQYRSLEATRKNLTIEIHRAYPAFRKHEKDHKKHPQQNQDPTVVVVSAQLRKCSPSSQPRRAAAQDLSDGRSPQSSRQSSPMPPQRAPKRRERRAVWGFGAEKNGSRRKKVNEVVLYSFLSC